MARRLIYVPIVHSHEDLGSVGERLRTVGEEAMSAEGWEKHRQQIAAFWQRLRVKLAATLEKELAEVGWQKLRIYQDGLPSGGEMGRRIVEEVAKRESANYQIVKELLERGALLEKTEDAALLQEEYGLIRQIVAALGPVQRARAVQAYRRRSPTLLGERDRFIAKRIDDSLKAGELGLLLIGAYHAVRSYLPKDIEVIPLP